MSMVFRRPVKSSQEVKPCDLQQWNGDDHRCTSVCVKWPMVVYSTLEWQPRRPLCKCEVSALSLFKELKEAPDHPRGVWRKWWLPAPYRTPPVRSHPSAVYRDPLWDEKCSRSHILHNKGSSLSALSHRVEQLDKKKAGPIKL